MRTLVVVSLTLMTAGSVAARASAQVPARRRLGAPHRLDVQPFPGTPDASPQTQIGFPALTPSQLESVTVMGSRSGSHYGRLVQLPSGRGTAFVPSTPFADGERVSVRALLRSPAAGTQSGAPNATRISFSFGVAATLHSAGAHAEAIRHDVRDSNGFTHSFQSEPWLHPPIAWMSGHDPDPNASGYIFADAENSIQAGPLIFSPQGQLIYFQPLHHAAAFNVQVQRYHGRSVLTYWQGYVANGVGIGSDQIVSHRYQTIATVHAGNGYHADLHAFQITPQGDALITAYVQVPHVDLRSIGGPRDGTLLDSVIQEIDIATGQVVWEWHAYGHVHLSESYAGKPDSAPYDFFHVNSIQQLPNGNLLISARHTWALYEINMQTGRTPEVIGGKHSYFKMGPGTNFEWQHHATMQADGTITVFDDGAGQGQSQERQSRALRIRLNYTTHRATLVHAYINNPPALASSQGNVQVLPDGNTFVGWGNAPYLTEFWKRDGRQLFSLHFESPLQSYRGYRFPWWGQPTTPPDISVAPTTQGIRVYASWNGATDVASWRVLAGPSPTALTGAQQFPKTFFETKMWVRTTQPYLAVQALNQRGQVLATSPLASR